MPYGTGWARMRDLDRIRDYVINNIDLTDKKDEKMEKCLDCGGTGIENGCIGEGFCTSCNGKGKVPIIKREKE